MISLEVNHENDLAPSCLFPGGNALLTCVTASFPRPFIQFLKDSRSIIPGAVGYEKVTKVRFDRVCVNSY